VPPDRDFPRRASASTSYWRLRRHLPRRRPIRPRSSITRTRRESPVGVATFGRADRRDYEHNAFGTRLVAIRKERRSAGIDRLARSARIGRRRGQRRRRRDEPRRMLTGHNPGDKATATAAELPRSQRCAPAPAVISPRTRGDVRSRRRRLVPPGHESIGDAFLAVARANASSPLGRRPEGVLLRRIALDLTASANAGRIGSVRGRRFADAYIASWTGSWPAPPTASAGGGTGWTCGATATGRVRAEVRESQPHVWRWRDWIVESLNPTPATIAWSAKCSRRRTRPRQPGHAAGTGFLVRNSPSSAACLAR